MSTKTDSAFARWALALVFNSLTCSFAAGYFAYRFAPAVWGYTEKQSDIFYFILSALLLVVSVLLNRPRDLKKPITKKTKERIK